MGHSPLGNPAGYDIGTVSRLLAVDDEPIIYRCVGADDDVVGADDVAAGSGDFSRLTVDDLFGVNSGVDPAAVAKNRAGKSFQVFQRVECRLSRESQRRPAVPETKRNTIDELGVRQSGVVSGFELSFQV